jgi:hypothetical protein
MEEGSPQKQGKRQMSAAIAEHGEIGRGTAAPFGIRFPAFLGGTVVYIALATMNAWPNLDAAMHGDTKAAAMAFVQFTFAFIVAISPVASAHEKGGQAAVLVFMLVNGYFAYDAASHRHDEARTTISRRAVIEAELADNEKKRSKLGDFEHVSQKQVEDATHKRDVAEASKDCWTCSRATRKARDQAAKDAQAALDRLMPLRTKTEDADNLDKSIVLARAELKSLKATGDSDDSLAKLAGGNAQTITTALTLLLALGIELANKYGPFWTFRFLIGGLGYPQSSPYERKKAQKAAERARKAREAEEAEERQRQAEARFAAELEARAAADAGAKTKVNRAAKRAEAKTKEKGDPETIEQWANSKNVILGPSHVALQSAAYDDYAADCKAHGQTPVAKGDGLPMNCGSSVSRSAIVPERSAPRCTAWPSRHLRQESACASSHRAKCGMTKAAA